jgi:hypothetical protein
MPLSRQPRGGRWLICTCVSVGCSGRFALVPHQSQRKTAERRSLSSSAYPTYVIVGSAPRIFRSAQPALGRSTPQPIRSSAARSPGHAGSAGRVPTIAPPEPAEFADPPACRARSAISSTRG